jgi:hypothetical protein
LVPDVIELKVGVAREKWPDRGCELELTIGSGERAAPELTLLSRYLQKEVAAGTGRG